MDSSSGRPTSARVLGESLQAGGPRRHGDGLRGRDDLRSGAGGHPGGSHRSAALQPDLVGRRHADGDHGDFRHPQRLALLDDVYTLTAFPTPLVRGRPSGSATVTVSAVPAAPRHHWHQPRPSPVRQAYSGERSSRQNGSSTLCLDHHQRHDHLPGQRTPVHTGATVSFHGRISGQRRFLFPRRREANAGGLCAGGRRAQSVRNVTAGGAGRGDGDGRRRDGLICGAGSAIIQDGYSRHPLEPDLVRRREHSRGCTTEPPPFGSVLPLLDGLSTTLTAVLRRERTRGLLRKRDR